MRFGGPLTSGIAGRNCTLLSKTYLSVGLSVSPYVGLSVFPSAHLSVLCYFWVTNVADASERKEGENWAIFVFLHFLAFYGHFPAFNRQFSGLNQSLSFFTVVTHTNAHETAITKLFWCWSIPYGSTIGFTQKAKMSIMVFFGKIVTLPIDFAYLKPWNFLCDLWWGKLRHGDTLCRFPNHPSGRCWA